jgi:hypothetical protein
MSEREEANYNNLLELFRSYCGAPVPSLPCGPHGGGRSSAAQLKLTPGRPTEAAAQR